MYSAAAQSLGVIREEIDILPKPRDTAEEAIAIRKLIDHKKKTQFKVIEEEKGQKFVYVLVTSASHMDRALREFKNRGLTLFLWLRILRSFLEPGLFHGGTFCPEGGNMALFEHYWHETLGSWWQTLRGV